MSSNSSDSLGKFVAVICFSIWCTLIAFNYAHKTDDACGSCNLVAYSVNLRMKNDMPADPAALERRVNETCNHVGCVKRTAKCKKVLDEFGPALAKRISSHAEETQLSAWPQSNLLAVQRILCLDLAQVCSWEMYDVGLHMEL
mmetsp:Transcript_1147/g.1606  ORF Transcript_1147/g.1606 Transcript_1147/m.1606 type:complete len:143 (-) Transcript_1147:288-716(-)|eukprot:CAMPEP_0196580186 /NCGR_PEP_ID=MMETSP1081-20130531/27667_1 /TAXON_ID=36882 /ORGANISM="Pyramimonas amylifera, Strain CCMP720" /LENGTH=142 /DNA_ID=CAMNT_0041899993 /DNA_START=69 /DNA_END=497 /DNA_ORIENTATION=-